VPYSSIYCSSSKDLRGGIEPHQQGGLANAGLPDNTDKFPFLDGQINFTEHFLLAITQGQLTGADAEHNYPRDDTVFSLKGI